MCIRDSYKNNGTTVDNTPVTPLTSGRTAAAAAQEYFRPVALGTGASLHQCGGTAFSGNFLNWATAHALDGFRFAMTGGDRVIDTSTMTVVEKSRHTGQGGTSQFPVKNGTAVRATATPFGAWAGLYARVSNNTTELAPFADIHTRGRVVQIGNNNSFNDITYTFLVRVQAVSYTHLDVYKRQAQHGSDDPKPVRT